MKAKEQGDEEKLGKVLNDAKFEDPTILVEYSKELKQTIIQGQGEHHLNILRTRIEKENKLSYDYIAPKSPTVKPSPKLRRPITATRNSRAAPDSSVRCT